MSLIVLIRDRRHSFCGNLKEMRFAGSTKLRTVSFHVLLFYDPMYNRSKFCHLSISQFLSQSLHNLLHLQYYSYLSTLFGSTHPLRVSELILYITSPLYLFSSRLMQLNICYTLHSWHEILTHSPTYWIFPPDSSQFAGCFPLQSMTITIYFCLSPNHAIICFTSSVT